MNILKRFTALAVSLLLMAAQLAAPVAALAQDVTSLPTVSLVYTDAQGQPQSYLAAASLYGDTAVYWATLPQEALYNGVQVQVNGVDPNLTYAPEAGTMLYPADASQVDGVSMAANIEAYQDGQLVSSYPLYISTQPMPSEQPEQPQNAWVTVEYLLNGGAIYSTTVELAPGDQMVYPDASLVPDYDLVSTEGVPVHVENDGTATPSYVSFTVAEKQAPAQNAWVTVQYECDNEVLNTTTVELTPGDHSLSPDEGMVPGGYALASYDAVTVSVGADGSAYPNPVTFTLTRQQGPEQPDQPTETDPGNTEEPGNAGDSGNNDGITVVRELNAYGVTTVGGLKLRDMPEGKAVFSSIKKGVNIYAYREVQFAGSSYNWYAIRYKETDCYVRADCFEMLSKEESDKLLYGDKAVELTVQGLDYDTNEVLYTDTVECPWAQSTPVTAREVQDYTVQGEATQTVTVDENGVASPEMVTFFYVKRYII